MAATPLRQRFAHWLLPLALAGICQGVQPLRAEIPASDPAAVERGQYEALRARLEGLTTATPPGRGSVAALIQLGELYAEFDEQSLARQTFARALAQAEQLGEKRLVALAAIGLGQTNLFFGEEVEAVEGLFARALQLARDLKDRSLEARALTAQASHQLYFLRLAESAATAAEARQVAASIGAQGVEVDALYLEATSIGRLGERRRGLALLEQGLRSATALNHPRRIQRLYTYVGFYRGFLEDYQGSLAAAQRAIEVGKSRGSKERQITAYIAQAAALRWLKRPEEAIASAEEALRLAEELQARGDLEIYCMNALGYASRDAGQFERAEAAFRRGRELAVRLGKTGLVAWMDEGLGEVADRRGDLEGAIAYFRRAAEPLAGGRARNPHQTSYLLTRVGNVQEKQGRPFAARTSYHLALQADPANGIASNQFIRLGRVLDAQLAAENREEASRYCQGAEQQPSAYALAQCALSLLQTEQPERALTLVDRSLALAQLTSERAYALYLRSTALTAVDRTTEARRALLAALALNPPSSLAADIELALGLIDDDPGRLRTARTLDPTIAQVSAVADLGGRQRQVQISVGGQGERPSYENAYVPPIYRKVLINGRPVLLMVDTGAAYTLLSPDALSRAGLRPTAERLGVSYADGHRESLRRYLPQTVALPGGRSLRPVPVLGGRGRENLLGRDLLRQIVSPEWFREAGGS